jgi:hypothetical protein
VKNMRCAFEREGGSCRFHDRLEKEREAIGEAVRLYEGLSCFPVPTQVSRTFSAMLQLINNGNVVIHRGGDTDAPFKLQVSDRDSHAHQILPVSCLRHSICHLSRYND